MAITDLKIDDEIKQAFQNAKRVGKLIPLILCLDKIEQLNDFKEITAYKKNLK